MTLTRIHLHWTAGGHKATATDRNHYHFIVEGDGTEVDGAFAPEDNLVIGDGEYAAHTLNANTAAIGVAVAAMRGAKERPFNPGPSPITPQQLDAFVRLCARLCVRYGISVTRWSVLTHAEVQTTLGIQQRGKWDITWLPGMDQPGTPIEVGDRLRRLISAEVERITGPTQVVTAPASFFAKLVAALQRLFTGGRT
jgi:hypothetical protein